MAIELRGQTSAENMPNYKYLLLSSPWHLEGQIW